MLSHTQGASFITFGTMNQTRNAAVKSRSERDAILGRVGQNAATAARGMKRPVLRNQNQAMFSEPWSQPNSNPKKVPALAMLS